MRRLLAIIALLVSTHAAAGQTITASGFKIEWQVVNGFRYFRDQDLFFRHEQAWRSQAADGEHPRGAVLGTERILAAQAGGRGWAAEALGGTCYDSDKRRHTACGGLDDYLRPAGHPVELWLTTLAGAPLPIGRDCVWRIAGLPVAKEPCGSRIAGSHIKLPYPGAAEISVGVEDEPPIMVEARVRDLLIVGLGDSFASGEGNPDRPVAFSSSRRHRNLYPLREPNNASGSAQWTDWLCHRSLYGHQMRAAVQIALENRQAAVTYLDYSCSGAEIDDGLLGPQTYVERENRTSAAAGQPAARLLSGGSTDSQLYRLLRELCLEKPERKRGQLVCPGGRFRRSIDLVFLSIGGNDVGFWAIVAWATLRDATGAGLAEFFGATASASDFGEAIRDVLPRAYARLAKAFAAALPVHSSADGVFDPSRIVLTAYPDLVTDENGNLCPAGGGEGGDEDLYAANQSLDLFSFWLVARGDRLEAVRGQFAALHRYMRGLAGDHGWTFAGQAYAGRLFEGHGFCARDPARAAEAAEMLTIPCWGEATRPTATCEQSWSGEVQSWRPYDPAALHSPYARRQRWVRSFNDAYMTVNQKVMTRGGEIDVEASAGVFSETTGALHPTAEGQAALADALLMDVRPMVEEMLGGE